jgi:NAD(P) transhydrogenase subunit alpha
LFLTRTESRVMTDSPPQPLDSSGIGPVADPPSTPRLVVGVVNERAPGERRVALVPESVTVLQKAGLDVLIECGAGADAWFSDDAYADAGADLAGTSEVITRADVVLMVGKPSSEIVTLLRRGQVVMGMLQPLVDPQLAQVLANEGVTAVSLDGLPRTLSRAQSMDALTSQANIAGYKAALLAADHYSRYFPMMITASGTARPADVLVLGAGVAGLQAMGTARRLGAVVTGYDVRPETKGEVESVGARFLVLKSSPSGSGEGGYARALNSDEQLAQQHELNEHISHRDVVITTAQVPGRRPPLLVTAEALKQMRAGAIVVDMGASELGGNVEGSAPDQTVVTDNGVSVIGAHDLAARVPSAASAAYSHNISALLLHLLRDGNLVIDLDDEIQAGVVVTHDGTIVHAPTSTLLAESGHNTAHSGQGGTP